MSGIRRTDSILTSTSLFAATSTIFVLLLGLLLEAAHRNIPFSLYPTIVYVQGNYFRIEDKNTPLFCPTVLADGTLDPARSRFPRPNYDPSLEAGFHAILGKAGDIGWFNDRNPLAYRWLPTEIWKEDQTANAYWAFRRDQGFQLYEQQPTETPGLPGKPRLIGSLTEDGLVPGHAVASSLRESNRMLLSSGIVYTTEKAVCIADFRQRKIRNVYSLRGDEGFAFDGRNILHILTPDRVVRIPVPETTMASPSPLPAADSIEIPSTFRKLHPYSLAMRSGGGIILKAEVPGTRTRDRVKYRVAVFDGNGTRKDEYEYLFSCAPLELVAWNLHQARWIEEEWIYMTDSFPGTAAGMILPPLWKLFPTGLVSDLFDPGDSESLRISQRQFGNRVWIVCLSLILAAVAWRWARRCGCTQVGAGAWSAAVFVLGLPMLGTEWILLRRQRQERCATCGRISPSRFEKCPCGIAVARPLPLGIEIVRPA